jgi:phosphoglycerate dehydrogenase-like enzyme
MKKTIEVLITLPFTEGLLEKLRSVSPDFQLTVIPARKVEEIPPSVWAVTEVLYTTRVLPMPEQVPMLRWIQFHWAGVDHALDMPILKKPDILLTTLSGAAASQMAEYAVMMMIALGRHIPELSAYQKKGEWPSERWEQFNPLELRGSTVGIVGYGSVGRQIARLLQVFGATVLATKRDPMHPEDQGYILEGGGDPQGDFVHRLYPVQAVRSMLKLCDFVVVTVPLTPETRGLIGQEELAVMRPSAYLVDISRGGVINHSALVTALKERKIAGAGLDVFADEPLPSSSPLWKLPNVILTPHLAGFSPHYDERAVDLFAENLRLYASRQPLYNQINLEVGY